MIGDSGAEALASALAGNKHLETLELPGECGCASIDKFSWPRAQLCLRNTGNEIGQQGAHRLLACLGQNNVLTTVDLEGTVCCLVHGMYALMVAGSAVLSEPFLGVLQTTHVAQTHPGLWRK